MNTAFTVKRNWGESIYAVRRRPHLALHVGVTALVETMPTVRRIAKLHPSAVRRPANPT